MNEELPVDLGAAIAIQPMWIQVWVMALVVIHVSAVLFAITKQNGKFTIRLEAVSIVLSFSVAGALMNWMYDQLGYVRLLGLPHLLFWLPVYVWLLKKYRRNVFIFPFKPYLIMYFFIAGMSLIIDSVDVVRYFLKF